MSSDVRILSTKTLKANQRQFLLNAGFSVVDADFIRVTLIPFQIRDVAENLIVTSQNGAKALASHPEVQQIRRNPVFCVGPKTADLLDELGFTVQETAANAEELAQIIVSGYQAESFTFFSGNIRRNELPVSLLESGVELNEIEVYETELTPVRANLQTDGILFFSPSGVKSYLSENTLSSQVCFCIGNTTENEIRVLHPEIRTVVSNQPTIESTIAKCVMYFANQTQI